MVLFRMVPMKHLIFNDVRNNTINEQLIITNDTCMAQLKMEDFIDRVLTTSERVKFSQADPYGHLNTAEYVDMVLNHRLEALATLAGINLMTLAELDGIAFVIHKFSVNLFAPSMVGDKLEIASWIAGLQSNGMEVRGIVIGEEDRKTRAAGIFDFITIDTKRGRPIPPPEVFESRYQNNPLVSLPFSYDYLEGIKRIPDGW